MDWDKIEQLLGIAEKALKWPELKHIHDAAMDEVKRLTKKPDPAPVAKTTPPIEWSMRDETSAPGGK